MGTMKKIAITSAIGFSMLSGVAFAAVTPAMQNAANAETQNITKSVNVTNASIECNQAALRIAKAARNAASPDMKGAVLHSAVANATSAAAVKYKIASGCVTPVLASNSASAVTGVQGATGPSMGLAKAGGLGGAAGGLGGAAGGLAGAAGGLAGAAGGLAGFGGLGLLGAAAAVAGAAAIANNLKDDDPASP